MIKREYLVITEFWKLEPHKNKSNKICCSHSDVFKYLFKTLDDAELYAKEIINDEKNKLHINKTEDDKILFMSGTSIIILRSGNIINRYDCE